MQANHTFHFFEHEQMDFEVRAGLGGAYYGSTDPGEVLATVERIEDGNFESWFSAFQETGDRRAFSFAFGKPLLTRVRM